MLRIQKTDQNLKMQVYNISLRKLHFQANLCEVFAKDKKQHYCGDLVLGWADLLFVQSSRIIILDVCRQPIPLISRSVNLISYEEGNFFSTKSIFW